MGNVLEKKTDSILTYLDLRTILNLHNSNVCSVEFRGCLNFQSIQISHIVFYSLSTADQSQIRDPPPEWRTTVSDGRFLTKDEGQRMIKYQENKADQHCKNDGFMTNMCEACLLI